MTTCQKCALCPQLLSDKHRTKEHIIPNAIGGRRKTTGFICKDCNNKFGESWDSELARQMNWFSLAIGISRERGETPKQIVQTVEGDKYWLMNDGSLLPEKSSHQEEDIDGGVRIKFTAKTINEAKQRLKGIARKYPNFDLHKTINELEIKTSYLQSPIHMNLSIGGPDAGRSLVKTAFAFASSRGVPHADCDVALEYLLSSDVRRIPYGFSYLSDLVDERPVDNVFHCVSLHGEPKKKRLWAYIEYFGFFRIIVLLSDNYNGPYRDEIYAINPIDGSSPRVRVKPNISNKEFSLILNGMGYDPEIHKAAGDYAIPIILKRSDSRTFDRTVKEGFDYAARKLGIERDEIIPKDKAREFTALMMEKISPYIENLVRNGRR